MRQTIYIITRSIVITGFMASLLSCGPVHRFTRIKKIPREYAMNYCAGEVKARRQSTWFKHNPWIVFSDKPDNMTYQSATGKNELKEIQYMDAFLVIKRKGEWLKVIKYDPAILQNGKLKEWKQAKYCGWINKNDLLLTQNTVTDITTGFKNKMVTILTDTTSLENPSHYFIADSVRLYQDSDLTKEQGKVPLYSIVYPLKKSKDGEQTLIARKDYVSADSIKTDVLGWIDNALLAAIGQQLHIDVSSLPDSTLWFKDRKNKDTLLLREEQLRESFRFGNVNKAFTHSPVFSYSQGDTNIYFRTQIAMPVVDKRGSYVLNVNGNPISYNRFKQIEKSLSKINIVFVMEGKDEMIERFPSIVNVVQGLQPVLTNDEMFSFRFGAVLTFNERDNEGAPICPLTNNYMEMLDFLSAKSKNAKNLQPVYGIRGSWSGLRNAVDMFNKCPDETNILVVVGDKGFNSEWADSTLVNQMVRNNCRVLGFQLYGGEPDNFNNFVLQIGNMIDNYAPKISKNKREIIVYADQLRNENEYRETSKKNTYCLDFPNRSMTQGWLVFPQKNESLELEGLATSVDSLLLQVKFDNTLLVNSLYKAFEEVGNFRHKLDSSFVDYHHIQSLSIKPLVAAMHNTPAEWNLPAQPVVLPDSVSADLNYYLLVTENELKNLRKFVDKLSANEVDYKYETKKKVKKKRRKICDCPNDFLIMNEEGAYTSADSTDVQEYAPTRRIRRSLVRHYLKYRNRDKYCKIGRKTLLRMPLSEAQRRFTSCPTDNPFMEVYRVKDLKRKKMIPDETLDNLIEYFKAKKKELDKAKGKAFQSNGQTYYWVDRRMLP